VTASPLKTADLFAQALAAHRAGDLVEAERLYRAALAVDPAHVLARTNLATAWLQAGRLEEGVEALRRSLEIDPRQAGALNNLGSALRVLGRPDEALDAYRQAVAAEPDYAEARANLAGLLHEQGMALRREGRLEEALPRLQEAADVAPPEAAAVMLNDLGATLLDLGRPAQAAEPLARALALDPAYAAALNNQALALHALDRLDEAAARYDAAVALEPGAPALWLNRAETLCALGRFAEALDSLERTLALDPRDAEARVRRGDVLGYLGRVEEARSDYEAALAIDPQAWRAAFHLAFPLLRQGRYEEGLAVYERRWAGALKDAVVELPRPKWLGETPAAGKTLLLHSEQGHGDTLMMLRYAPLLARQGATVILSVQPPLERLAAAVEGVSAVIPQGEPLPPYDLHIPMMSLPLAFGTRPATVPGQPYLRAPEAERAMWAERLGPRRRPRIGLAWSGNPTQKDDRWRSLPLERLAPLFDLDADLYALQTEVREADRLVLRAAPVHDLSGELRSYADTAAVMEAMDLVITVCTSAANLAGGLGRPTLVMLGAVADWRWGEAPDRSPWYPSARLFRQPAMGAWDEVVARVKAAAEGLAKLA
jgi:tetratricopeptide (TPR) repeat protein